MVIGRREDGSRDLPVALAGRVAVLADDSCGPIAPGDLLVSAETPGFACRADDPVADGGAILGKALEVLEGHQGLIQVLIGLR